MGNVLNDPNDKITTNIFIFKQSHEKFHSMKINIPVDMVCIIYQILYKHMQSCINNSGSIEYGVRLVYKIFTILWICLISDSENQEN